MLRLEYFMKPLALSEKLRVRVKDYFNMKVPQLDRKSRVDLFESIESNAQWSFDFVAFDLFFYCTRFAWTHA